MANSILSKDKLEEAFQLLSINKFVLTPDKTWFACPGVQCTECPLDLVSCAGNGYRYGAALGCKSNFMDYLKENYEELIV